MKIIKNPFTKEEIKGLTNNYSRVAREFGVTPAYVQQIATGQKDTISEMSIKILKRLQEIAKVMTAVHTY